MTGKFYNESGIGLPFYQGKKDFRQRSWSTNEMNNQPKRPVLAIKINSDVFVRAPVLGAGISTSLRKKFALVKGALLQKIRSGGGIDEKSSSYYALLSKKSEISGNGVVQFILLQ